MNQPEKESSSRPKSHASASHRLYVHLIWPTKYRKPILGQKLTPIVETKISEVCETKGYKLIDARAIVDHVHVLLGFKPTHRVSDIVRDLKANTSKAAFETFSQLRDVINMDVLWAEGYRAESVSPGHLNNVKQYIESQAKHHQDKVEFRAKQDAKKVNYGEATSQTKETN
jgi:putative transposase